MTTCESPNRRVPPKEVRRIRILMFRARSKGVDYLYSLAFSGTCAGRRRVAKGGNGEFEHMAQGLRLRLHGSSV